jgi:hypothetical protein
MNTPSTPSKPTPGGLDDLVRWLLLVGAITVGSFLGLVLFMMFSRAEIRHEMHDIPFPSITTTTPAWPT